MPKSVLIQYDTCRMTLYLPAFFDGSSLANVRKAFKLLSERPHQNAPAFETFNLFFPAWEQHLKQQLESDTQEKKEAEQTARAAESQVACFGTMATKEMKAELQKAQSTLKKAAQTVKRTKSALERCGKIKNAYNEILR